MVHQMLWGVLQACTLLVTDWGAGAGGGGGCAMGVGKGSGSKVRGGWV